MKLDFITKFIESLQNIQKHPLFTWRLYPLIVISIDVTVAFAPIKNIISQLPFTISPYFPVIAISTLVVFLEIKFGTIRRDILLQRLNSDLIDDVEVQTNNEVLKLVKFFIFIIPALVVYEGIMQCVNHYELEMPIMAYVSTIIKYFALASLSFTTHRILFLYAHKIEYFDRESK